MYLKFESVEIEGFQSIGKATISLDQQGVVLVRGINNYDSNASSNGSGKSSIFQSIMYCIYGKTSDGISDPSNRYYKDGCCVKLRFSVDNQNYTIIRSAKHSVYKSTVKLYKGDEEISARNKSDTDKMIKSDVMPISQDIFLSTVFLSQGFSGRLSVLTPAGRKERIEVLTDTASQVDEFRDKLMSVKNDYSNKYDQCQRDHVYKKGTVDSLNRQIWQLQTEINRIDSSKPDGSIDELNGQLSILDEALKKYNEGNSVLATKLTASKSLSDKLRYRVSELTRNNDRIKHEIDDLKSGRPCPTCGRPMLDKPDPSVIKSKLDEIKSNSSEISKCNSKINEITSSIESLESEVITYNDKISGVNSKQSSIRNKIAELAKYRDTTEDKEKIKDLQSQIYTLNQEMIELQNDESMYESLRDVAHHCTSLVSKQFRGYLLNETIEFMNRRLIEYSSMLFSNESDLIHLTVDSTKLDIYLGDALYDTLSGGERKKVDIALVLTQRDLALNISGMSCNLLILDEIIENCDQVATNAVLDMLSKAAVDIESMFIISHNSYTVSYDSVITVVKDRDRTSSILIS